MEYQNSLAKKNGIYIVKKLWFYHEFMTNSCELMNVLLKTFCLLSFLLLYYEIEEFSLVLFIFLFLITKLI